MANWWEQAFAEDDVGSGDWWTRERTFGLGDQQAAAVDEAAQAQIANDVDTKKRLVLEQAKASRANAPYAQAGQAALNAQRDLLGLNGPEAQRAAEAQLMASPQFQSMVDQSEQAILANASATGGLRGGNVQQALAQNRPQILTDLINQQYGRFGGLAAAGRQGSQFTSGLGLQSAGMVGNVNTSIGQAQAGGILGQEAARLQARQGLAGAALQGAGQLAAFRGQPGGLMGTNRQTGFNGLSGQGQTPYSDYGYVDSPIGAF